MDENREGPLVRRDEVWTVDHAALWCWITDALEEAAVPALDRAALRGLCLRVLDTHAPAALVHAHAVGIALERLVTTRLTEAYGDHPGRLHGRYNLVRLRATAAALRVRASHP